MTTLWQETDPARWSRALEHYPAAIEAHGVNRLPKLDAWYRQELPGLLAARIAEGQGRLTYDELVRVTEWKMKRGVWRARNLVLVRGNAADEVERASVAAFAALPDLRKPLTALTQLAGVGPATASAVLAAVRPDLFPFFDDVIAAQIPDLGPVAFTAAYYARYAAQLRDRAAVLGPPWTAHQVGQALWANAD
jgi:hypothetical protein